MPVRRPTTRSLAVLATCAIALVAVLASPGAASAATKKKRACPTAGITKAQNTSVRLYTTSNDEIAPVYACRFRDGRPFKLDAVGGQECQNARRLSLAVLSGDMIAISVTECELETAFDHLSVWNAKTRKQTRKVENVVDTFPPTTADPGDGATDVNDIVLRSNGAVAWVASGSYTNPKEPTTFQVRLLTAAGASQVLDTGTAIDPKSLALASGGRLYWVNGGTVKSGSL